MRIAFDVKLLLDMAGEDEPETLPLPAALEALVREQFSFLPQPIEIEFDGWTGVITFPDASPAAVAESKRLSARAARRASEGDYDKAVRVWRRVLELEPANNGARRDLAMALVEQDKTDEAKDYLIDVLRVEPDDVHSLVVLANLYHKSEQRLETSERLLTHALAVAPDDPWAINSLATLRMQQGRVQEAVDLFARCMAVAPSFANPYLGMAVAQRGEGRLDDARQTLERLFASAEIQDARSLPIFAEARGLYASLMADLAVEHHDEALQAIEDMKRALADETGFEIRVEAAETPGMTAAFVQMAWKYGRDHHLIVHREDYPEPLLLHLIAHEMGHLRLEAAARAQGRNQLFVSTAANRETAIRSMAKDVARWQRQGFSDEAITELTQQLTDGIARQIFNTPIDMLIEAHLHRESPKLQASQFLSLAVLAREAAQASMDSDIRRQLPRHITYASAALNGATALFLDRLYAGATTYADVYRGLDSFPVSQQLLSILDDRSPSLAPGDEYELVDAWADVLGLQGWYGWRPDDEVDPMPVDAQPAEAGGPETVEQEHPAAVWFLLSALERYEPMTDDEVQAIAFEIAILGMGGLDHASSEQKYTLETLPGERFSGLQATCLMYAGFARIAPGQDTGMDLKEPFQVALQLHEARKRKRA